MSGTDVEAVVQSAQRLSGAAEDTRHAGPAALKPARYRFVDGLDDQWIDEARRHISAILEGLGIQHSWPLGQLTVENLDFVERCLADCIEEAIGSGDHDAARAINDALDTVVALHRYVDQVTDGLDGLLDIH